HRTLDRHWRAAQLNARNRLTAQLTELAETSTGISARSACSAVCAKETLVNHSTILCTAVLALGFSTASPATARAQDDDAADLKLAEPDFTLAALPTSLRMPRNKWAFRVTHRFTRPLNPGPGEDFGDVAGDLFGIDGGAAIGLELRFGL